MKKVTLAAAAMSAFLLALGTRAQAVDPKLNSLDRTFMTTVSQGNMAEVMSSQLALKKSSNKKVRMVADMLVKQHSQAEGDLKKVASMVKVNLPAGTDAEHKALYRKLSGQSGAAFDKTFMAAQVKDHYKTIALFNKELANGSQSDVHSFATRYLPDIETHTQMITSVASNMGLTVATKKPMKTAKM